MKKKTLTVSESSKIYQQVGHKIRSQRVWLGYTTKRLGILVGISQQQISRYELGKSRMTISCLFNIAEALQVSPNWLLEDVIIFKQKINEWGCSLGYRGLYLLNLKYRKVPAQNKVDVHLIVWIEKESWQISWIILNIFRCVNMFFCEKKNVNSLSDEVTSTEKVGRI